MVKLTFLTLLLESCLGDELVTFVYTLPRLHISNINRFNEKKWFHSKKDKKHDILQELRRTQTIWMI